MNLLCDADVDRPLVDILRQEGHSVGYVQEIDPTSEDEEVLAMANSREAVLVTRDKDFGELVFRQNLVARGVLLIRLSGLPMSTRKQLLLRAIREHGDQYDGAFSVLTPGGLRIRPRLPGRGIDE